MADISFRYIIVTLLLFGLLSLAIINVGIFMAQQNNAVQSIGNDASIGNYSQLVTANITDNYLKAGQAQGAVDNSSIATTTSIPFITAIGGIWKTLRTFPVAMINLIFNLILVKLFGTVGAIIIVSALSAIVLVTILFTIVEFVSTARSG